MSRSQFPEVESRLMLAAYFAKAMISELGQEEAMEIIGQAYQEYANDDMAELMEGASEDEERFARLVEWQRELASKRPEIRIVEASARRLAIEIHTCRNYEVYKQYGVAEVCQKYCDADFAAAKVVSPRVTLTRSKEIAYGAPYCNHCWTLED
jgi:predicted ArsR family transcriptional regulator